MIETEYAERLQSVEDRAKSNTHRIDNLSERIEAINRLATAVELMAAEQKHQTTAMNDIKTDVASLGAKVETLEHKPAQKWDSIVDKVIWAILAAVIAFVLARIGL